MNCKNCQGKSPLTLARSMVANNAKTNDQTVPFKLYQKRMEVILSLLEQSGKMK